MERRSILKFLGLAPLSKPVVDAVARHLQDQPYKSDFVPDIEAWDPRLNMIQVVINDLKARGNKGPYWIVMHPQEYNYLLRNGVLVSVPENVKVFSSLKITE